VRESLLTLQKLFRLRPCKDSFFDSRQRPCLQHQIGRCSAPCVGLVSVADYADDVAAAVRLLEGRGEELTADLAQSMERAAEALEFERAARLRDQIVALRRVRESRAITGGAEQLDVVAVAPHAARSALVVVQVRDGLNLGHASHFPRHPVDTAPEEVVAAFLEQHYVDWPPPGEILLSHWPPEAEWITESLSTRAGRRVRLLRPQRGVKRQLMQMAQETAAQALSARIAQSSSADQRLRALQQGLELSAPPARIECFDISHTMGERPVASCVVFEDGQPHKVAYRKFNIEDVTPGDDYAAIAQAIRRRLARVAAGEGRPPDLLLIDGGRGQLTAAQTSLALILAEADEQSRAVLSAIRLVAVAKGPTRRPGLEQLWLPERKSAIVLPPDSPGLHLIQQIRDEAHRFAITGHRGRRDKARRVSTLEQIEGLGPARRRALLNTLGGLPQLKRAGIDDIAAVPGISRRLAERIHAFFH
jgi:Nuclease subunit of the excinuclease complex